ncbi:MAG: ATP-dependent DNA helicase [Myxococcota bacterium]|nr:ATP-dependent DNA helicase [Myxococcota bacterium]
MIQPIEWQVSVRELADHVWCKGDLRVGLGGAAVSKWQGAQGHRWLQQHQPECYEPEVCVSRKIYERDIILTVSGRADGIYTDASPVVVEEIKTTTESLMFVFPSNRPQHWAQAKLYGALVATQQHLKEIEVQLTYLQVERLETRSFKKQYLNETLERYFSETIAHYIRWLRAVFAWQGKRDRRLQSLAFPFATYRPGQAAMIRATEQLTKKKPRRFVEAATGSGKTIALLWGGLKALLRQDVSQIVFSTAKTVGQLSARQALGLLENNGARINSVWISSRNRACLYNNEQCSLVCPLAKGFYDRLPMARDEMMKRPCVADIAREHHVCPYWFAREMAPWADVVVCDYNYLFDPRVRLRALGDPRRGPKLLLVDEAHNLVDRAREMYSAEIRMETVQHLLSDFKGHNGLIKDRLLKLRQRLQQAIISAKTAAGSRPVTNELLGALLEAIEAFVTLANTWVEDSLSLSCPAGMTSFFYECHAFLRAAQRIGRSDVTVAEGVGTHARLKIFCLDPAGRLKETMDRMGAYAVYFSATLSPIRHFSRLLGGDERDVGLTLPSPFNKDNLCTVVVDYISTRYKDRFNTLKQTAETIQAAAMSQQGHYIAFFPSYQYLNDVAQYLPNSSASLRTVMQTPALGEADKRRFLAAFERKQQGSLLGLAVLGGLFGEGIDLVGKRLIGVIIVSPGLPKVCIERERIGHYFDTLGADGFKHAYLYPGMNRVVQAGGRLIRSERDRGVIILIGDRFTKSAYANLLPDHWKPSHRVSSLDHLVDCLATFWSKSDHQHPSIYPRLRACS